MAKRMVEKSCQCQVHRTWYRLHASSSEAEVSTYSTEFDGSQDFSKLTFEKIPSSEIRQQRDKWRFLSKPDGSFTGIFQ